MIRAHGSLGGLLHGKGGLVGLLGAGAFITKRTCSHKLGIRGSEQSLVLCKDRLIPREVRPGLTVIEAEQQIARFDHLPVFHGDRRDLTWNPRCDDNRVGRHDVAECMQNNRKITTFNGRCLHRNTIGPRRDRAPVPLLFGDNSIMSPGGLT
ncbi:hypothetical protein J2Y48_002095 [Mycoplana sp. BE70]|nr:hypothetical protein [Mycoplana sp. BE70]